MELTIFFTILRILTFGFLLYYIYHLIKLNKLLTEDNELLKSQRSILAEGFKLEACKVNTLHALLQKMENEVESDLETIKQEPTCH